MSDVPQGSTLGVLLFNIFINDTDDWIKCTVSRSVDGTKLSSAIDPTEGRLPKGT